MGRGLSDLQKRVLDTLKDGKEIRRDDLSHLINGYSPTRSQIVALSKAISRLDYRGLIDIYYAGDHMGVSWSWPNGGFFTWWGGHDHKIQISTRGAAYLKGEALPPLSTTIKQIPGKCWCGEDLPSPDSHKFTRHHKQPHRKWKVELIG